MHPWGCGHAKEINFPCKLACPQAFNLIITKNCLKELFFCILTLERLITIQFLYFFIDKQKEKNERFNKKKLLLKVKANYILENYNALKVQYHLYHVNSLNNLKFMFTTRHFWDYCNRSARDWCFNNFRYYWVVRDQMKMWTNNEKLWIFFIFLRPPCFVFWGIISVIMGLLWIRYTRKKSFFQLLTRRRQIHNVHGLMCVKKWFLFTKKSHPTRSLDTFGQKSNCW